jgi:hypothetical protein
MVIFLSLIIFVALGCFIFGLLTLAKAHSSASWPSVPGFIEGSEVGAIAPNDPDTSYKPIITYRYLVDGREFRSSVIGFGLENYCGSMHFAQRYLATYPVGKTVEVFYKESSPGVSVLEPGISRQSFIPLQFGLLFLALGVGALLLYLHQEAGGN